MSQVLRNSPRYCHLLCRGPPGQRLDLQVDVVCSGRRSKTPPKRSLDRAPSRARKSFGWATLYNLVGVVKRHVECLRSASCCAGAELEFFLLIGKLLMLLLLTRLQLAFRILRWKLVPPTIYSVSGTMIRCSDSRLFGRQGAQSAQRWTVFHQGGPRAALHANQ